MDYYNLIETINLSYRIGIQHIELYREMIGRVFLLHNGDKQYVLKVYRSNKTDDALQTVRILDYLKANSYPVVSIVRSVQDASHIVLNCQDGNCIGIVYEYVEGETPDGKIEAELIGKQIGSLHQLMEGYPDKLIKRTKIEYIDDYISIMRELNVDSGKVLELEHYGNELWERMRSLPKGFSHGDLHTGNMIKNQRGQYVLFDFDEASGDYPSMDVAYMSDDTNFNHFHESAYDRTMRLYERFYSGYSKIRTLSDNEFHAVFDFIAIRHYQIISRIVRCQGLSSISKDFCDEQYSWLIRWKNLCMKNKS
ncbi:phosphotransferase [Paenibacillus marinisediminis]